MSGYRLSRAERELMVERLLRGEHAYAIAEDLGVDKTLPSLRAFTWGFREPRSAGPIDRHIAKKIRARRLEIGKSQEQLASDCGVTFQQVQKYEKAINRVSASRLFQVARSLDTSVGAFFEGYRG